MPSRGDNLHLAASRGKTYRVAACLANDEDPNSLDLYGRTPLTISIKKGHVEVVKALLRGGAQVNLRTREGTPIEVVLQQDRPSSAAVRELVLAGADLGRPDPKGYLPVQRAAVKGQTSALRELLSNCSSGKGRRSVLPRLDLDATVADSGKTAMCLAARKGHVEVVQMLLGAGANPSVADNRRWTPLHFAAWKGHLRVVWELLGAGVDCSPLSDKHWTPLLAAAVGGHSEVARQLIGAGASVAERTSNGWNALHMASQAGHIDVVRALLVAGARPGAVGEKGWTALMAAAAEGHGAIVRELLLLLATEDKGKKKARGGNGDGGGGGGGGGIDARNGKGCTALIMAARNGFADVVRDLLEAGADTTPSIAGGWTALAAACAGGHDRAAGYLLRAGADPDQRDGLGRTLLHDAAEDCRWDVVRELLRAGADPDAVTDAGETPLSLAGMGGSFEVIRELLQAGAEPLAVGPKSATTPQTTAASAPSIAGGSPGTTTSSVRSSISSSASSSDKWRDFRFKAEKAASGVHSPAGALSPSSAAAAAAPTLLELGAKQGKQHPLLLELRRNTAPPEFPGSVRTPTIRGPSLRRSEVVVADVGSGYGGVEQGQGQGQGRLTHSASA